MTRDGPHRAARSLLTMLMAGVFLAGGCGTGTGTMAGTFLADLLRSSIAAWLL
ncbi:MAG: hypothetical protein ACE5E6_07080 [Phycisphaerae bacterium]